MIPFSRTKIVATVGPASDSKEMLFSLVEAGVNVFRLNFSHSNHEKHAAVIKLITEINHELGTNVAILADLQGPKIRLGQVENEQVELERGDIVSISIHVQASTKNLLYVSYEDLARDVAPGDRILIDDGKIELKVISSNMVDEVKAEIIYGGIIKANKGVNLPDTAVSAPSLTPKDLRDLEFILTQNVNWIALSFVRTADEITRLKGMIQFKGHSARVIAKIEKPEAYQNIDAIIQVSDAIMVARGDLGVELPLERIPVIQKDIVNKCINAARPVIIATQMMETMINNSTPTRAEITDVATAMFDGADALMLSGETATGKYAVKVIETLKRVIINVEEQDAIYHTKLMPNDSSVSYLSDMVCYTASQLAKAVSATSIIALTSSGYTAFMLSSFRPKCNIYVFTESEDLLNAVSLVWGTRAYLYHRSSTTEDTVREVQKILMQKGFIKKAEVVINTGSTPFNEHGPTNTIKLTTIH